MSTIVVYLTRQPNGKVVKKEYPDCHVATDKYDREHKIVVTGELWITKGTTVENTRTVALFPKDSYQYVEVVD